MYSVFGAIVHSAPHTMKIEKTASKVAFIFNAAALINAQQCAVKAPIVPRSVSPAYFALPAQDCIVGSGEWQPCTSDGYQNKTNVVIQPALYGGQACPTFNGLLQTRACPVACNYKVVNWGPCDPATGLTYRSKTLIGKSPLAASLCAPDIQETQVCSVDCVLDWGKWSTCDLTTNLQTQLQTVVTPRRLLGLGIYP